MKILIIRFSSIGDIVLTSPVARCLKEQLNTEVHYLTKQRFAQVLEHNPNIDKIFSIKNDISSGLLRELRKENYDWVIDLHRNLRSARVKLALRCPARSFDKLNFQKWLLVRFGVDLLPDKHIVDRYLETVNHLGVENDGLGLDYFIPEDEEVKLEKFDPALAEGDYLAFNIGANHATKRLPVDKITTICRSISSPVVLLGGHTESEDGTEIARLGGSHVFNFCGKLSLHQSASVVRQAAKVVTHDSGLMHIAAAFNKEIISIWGNTIPKFGMYPYDPLHSDRNTTMEVSGLKCRPCSKIGYDRCPRGHFKCMNDQDIDKISAAMK